MRKSGRFLFVMCLFASLFVIACEGETVTLLPPPGDDFGFGEEGEGEGEGEGESVEDQTPIPSEGEGEGEGEGTDESQQGLDECGELGCQPPLNPDGQECPAGGCEAPLNPDDTGEGEGEGQALTPSEGEGEGQNQNPSEGEGEGQAPAEGEGEGQFTPDGIHCRTAVDCVLVGETTHCDGNVVVAMGNPVCNADRQCEYGVVRTDCGAEARCSTEGGTAHCAALPSCDDSDPCTTDTRNGDGSCGHTAKAVGTSCGDGLFCMDGMVEGVTTCEQVTCQDDGDECTREVLDPALIGVQANPCRTEQVTTQTCRWRQEVTCSFACPSGITSVYVWHSGWNGLVSCGSNLVVTWGELCGWEYPSFSFNGRDSGSFWGRGDEITVSCDAGFENRPNPLQGDLGKRDLVFREDGSLGTCRD